MAKDLVLILVAVAVSLGLAFVAGCESDAQTGALIGTAVGAGAGQVIGGDTEATLIGAAVGGGAGYIVGSERDKKKTKAEIDSLRQEMNTVTVNITNSNGSITPVMLRKQGVVYIGPRGETYTTLPTEEQLKQAGYGF
ncbi:MAG TPA: YMGG-like glycine zipper-containing protein [Sedimentisphaerales bacterium]|nr:YMGG-like glycine zipper-containing protein [Sedimentisphaerales bacterium]